MLTVESIDGELLMPISLEDLVYLRRQIEVERKKLDQRDQALAVLHEMLSEQGGVASVKIPAAELTPEMRAAFKDMTFTEVARTAVSLFTGEFTSADIEGFVSLHAAGTTRPKKPRSMIGMLLSEMERNGRISLVKKGVGSSPNRYRVIT